MKIIVVGAGPTGLVLGLWLARLGIKAKIIDKASGPGETSRAMAVQARTLEYYRQLGFADQIVAQGIKAHDFEVFEHSKQVARINFSDFGQGISPYPFILTYPQDEHERFLGDRIREAGQDIQWGVTLEGLEQREDGVLLTLNGQTEEFDYVCGCDGAHSAVREQLGLGFPGETYKVLFYVADVTAEGEVSKTGFRAHFGKNMIQLVFPIRSTGHFRLIGMVPPDQVDNENVTFDDIRKEVEEGADIRVSSVAWFSRYRVHHRVAEKFRVGRCFLVGDAGHIHSPVGGQAMNTGIGDAVNLAWKLAELENGGNTRLLDTYEQERLPFAKALAHSTDQVFRAVIDPGWKGLAFRDLFIGHILPLLLGFSVSKRAAFRLISQTKIDYRDSPISEGVAGDVHGGDRLPWIDENFDALRSLDWQVHVYGGQARNFGEIPAHFFPWTSACVDAGIVRDAGYLVRPDGYVALADPNLDQAGVEQFMAQRLGRDLASSDRGSRN